MGPICNSLGAHWNTYSLPQNMDFRGKTTPPKAALPPKEMSFTRDACQGCSLNPPRPGSYVSNNDTTLLIITRVLVDLNIPEKTVAMHSLWLYTAGDSRIPKQVPDELKAVKYSDLPSQKDLGCAIDNKG